MASIEPVEPPAKRKDRIRRKAPRKVSEGDLFGLPLLCRYFSEFSPLPMIAVEGTTHVVRYLNGAFARLVGKEREELVGRPFADAIPEGKSNQCVALLDQVYRTGTAANLGEQKHLNASPAFWSYSLWPIFGPDDRPAGILVHVSDVTEMAVFRRQVTEMNEALVLSSVQQHELTETAGQLNDSLKASEAQSRRLLETAREQAEALAGLDRRKDEFLAMLGHELRNPLAPIVNAMHLLDLETNDVQVQRQTRLIIERQVTQLTHLIDDLMDVSRISTGKFRLRLGKVLVSEIVEHAVDTTRPLIDEHRHELVVSLPPEPIWLEADATRLEQVVVNLLTNSAKYTADGGHISLSVELAGDVPDEILLRVRDTGVGIAPELLPLIFDLFTQAHQSLDRSHGGLGIGLTLVQRLVGLHHGRVEARSSLGHGSEFIVRLPVIKTPASQTPATPATLTAPADTSLRVLVVDDNVDGAETLAMLIKAKGYDVRTAYTGPGALEAVIDDQPHVVLLDIGLPELDGFEVARRIRQHQAGKPVVLIAITGYGQVADQQRSMEAGFDHHLVKPADFRKVEEILATAKAT